MNAASLYGGGAIRKDLPSALRIGLGLIIVPLIKNWIPGAAGTISSCFFQMFYVSFLFPWCIRHIAVLNKGPGSEKRS